MRRSRQMQSLNADESALVAAVRKGVAYGDVHAESHVRAEIIRSVILGRLGDLSEHRVQITHTTIEGNLDLADIDWPGQISLTDCTFSGDVDLSNSSVRGGVDLSGSSLEMLTLSYARVEGFVRLTKARLKRGLHGVDMSIRGGLRLTGAELTAPPELPARAALDMFGSRLGDVFAQRAVFRGGIYAPRVQVARNFRLFGSKISSRAQEGWEAAYDAGPGVTLNAAKISGNLALVPIQAAAPTIEVLGSVDLRDAYCQRLILSKEVAARNTFLVDRLEYEHLPGVAPSEMLDLLDRERPTPTAAYVHLAKVCERNAEPALSRNVLIRLNRRLSQDAGGWRRVTGFLEEVLIGYGHHPARVLPWLLVSILLGAGLLYINPSYVSSKITGMPLVTFAEAFALSLDHALPFPALEYKSQWVLSPVTIADWWFFAGFASFKVSAWVFSALGLAAITGLIRRR